jgi:hypothetical protein
MEPRLHGCWLSADILVDILNVIQKEFVFKLGTFNQAMSGFPGCDDDLTSKHSHGIFRVTYRSKRFFYFITNGESLCVPPEYLCSEWVRQTDEEFKIMWENARTFMNPLESTAPISSTVNLAAGVTENTQPIKKIRKRKSEIELLNEGNQFQLIRVEKRQKTEEHTVASKNKHVGSIKSHRTVQEKAQRTLIKVVSKNVGKHELVV